MYVWARLQRSYTIFILHVFYFNRFYIKKNNNNSFFFKKKETILAFSNIFYILTITQISLLYKKCIFQSNHLHNCYLLICIIFFIYR